MIPLAKFHCIVPGAIEPIRADRSALGTLPTAALQYCEAITSASAFGWYAFPPVDFHVQYDGRNFVWTHADADSWFPVRSEHAPDFEKCFDAGAPSDLKGCAPPFLTALPQPGVLQIWSGVLVRTRPGWSLLARAPANIARSRDYDVYEGIIEADRWFYPLFINVRITTSDRPLLFDRHQPLLQAQPLIRATYDEAELRTAQMSSGIDALAPADWEDFRASLGARAKEPLMRPGRYATSVRKRAAADSVGQ